MNEAVMTIKQTVGHSLAEYPKIRINRIFQPVRWPLWIMVLLG
jgi:hypothetical protein